jgi:hypothetical protein
MQRDGAFVLLQGKRSGGEQAKPVPALVGEFLREIQPGDSLRASVP